MKRKILTIIFIYLFAMLAVITLAKPLAQDEGVFLTIAKGIVNGQLPYRDFFDHKPAGIYFALMPLVKLFGNSMLAPKALLLLINLATIVFTFLISQKIKINGLVSCIFVTFGMIFFESNFIIAEPFVALLLALSIYLIVSKQIPQNYLYAGAAIGAAILFKQTAIINLIAIFAILSIYKKWRSLLSTMIGVAIVLLPFVLYLWRNNLAAPAYDQIILANIFNYPREPIAQIVSNLWLVFLITIPLWALAAIGASTYWRKKPNLIFIFAILPIPLLLIRHYPHYWMQIMPFIAILAAYSFGKINIRYRFLFLASIIIISVLPITHIKQNFILLKEQIAISKFVNTRNEQYLLAENQASPYYYLTNKKPLNKYLYITEVNNWQEKSEDTTIKDLETNDNVLIIWPSDQNFAYAKNLQKYISDNFRIVKEYKNLRIEIKNK